MKEFGEDDTPSPPAQTDVAAESDSWPDGNADSGSDADSDTWPDGDADAQQSVASDASVTDAESTSEADQAKTTDAAEAESEDGTDLTAEKQPEAEVEADADTEDTTWPDGEADAQQNVASDASVTDAESTSEADQAETTDAAEAKSEDGTDLTAEKQPEAEVEADADTEDTTWPDGEADAQQNVASDASVTDAESTSEADQAETTDAAEAESEDGTDLTAEKQPEAEAETEAPPADDTWPDGDADSTSGGERSQGNQEGVAAMDAQIAAAERLIGPEKGPSEGDPADQSDVDDGTTATGESGSPMDRWEAGENAILRYNADYFESEARRDRDQGNDEAADALQEAADRAPSYVTDEAPAHEAGTAESGEHGAFGADEKIASEEGPSEGQMDAQLRDNIRDFEASRDILRSQGNEEGVAAMDAQIAAAEGLIGPKEGPSEGQMDAQLRDNIRDFEASRDILRSQGNEEGVAAMDAQIAAAEGLIGPKEGPIEGQMDAQLRDNIRDFEAERNIPEQVESQEARALSAGVADRVSYGDMDPDIAKEITDTLIDLKAEFPGVELTSVTSEEFVGDMKNAYAYYDHSNQSLHFNTADAMGGNKETLETNLSQDIAAGFHPEGHRSAKGLATHEFAHAVHSQNQSEVDAAVVNVLDRTGVDAPRPPSYYWVQSDAGVSQVAADVGDYANTNFTEFVAECCAEGRNNPSAAPIAREVWAAVRKSYP